MVRLCPFLVAAIGTALPAVAHGEDEVEIVVSERSASEHDDGRRVAGTAAPPSGSTTTRTVQVIERAPLLRETTWIALGIGAVTTPLSRRGALPYRERMDANSLHACIDDGAQRWCSPLRGADVRLQIFSTRGRDHYPRVIGYARSGFETGEARLESARASGPRRGDAVAVRHRSVPIFAGVSVYAFERFPVRPFVGLGMGVDVLQLRWTRHERTAVLDVSPRFGFELHGGVEARIGNWVAITAELQQQWSVRRRHPDVPDFADTRLALVTGVAVALPYGSYSRREARVERVTTSTRTVAPTSPPPSQLRVGPPTTAPVFPSEPTPPRTILVAPPTATPPTAAPAGPPSP